MKPAGLKLTLHSVPAAQGLRWITLGWQVFRRAPLSQTGLLASFLVLATILSLLGPVGTLLSLSVLPLVSLIFMLSTHQLLQSKRPGLQLLAQPFRLTRSRSQAQLLLGIMYVLATVAVMALGDWMDGGRFEALQRQLALAGQGEAAQRAAEAAMSAAMGDSQMLLAMLVRFTGVLLISVPFWHAPALVHWGGQGAPQALFSSTLGIWHNKGAFTLNGIGWLGLMFGCSMTLAILSGLLGLGQMVSLLVMPLTLVLATVFYAGLYFMFVDSFRFVAAPGVEAQSAEPAPPDAA